MISWIKRSAILWNESVRFAGRFEKTRKDADQTIRNASKYNHIDEEGYCRTWREVKRYPEMEKYALCRCSHSKNKPFCDGRSPL